MKTFKYIEDASPMAISEWRQLVALKKLSKSIGEPSIGKIDMGKNCEVCGVNNTVLNKEAKIHHHAKLLRCVDTKSCERRKRRKVSK
jgi:hypothetical protein